MTKIGQYNWIKYFPDWMIYIYCDIFEILKHTRQVAKTKGGGKN